jgi:hypothetical protein
MENFLSPFTKGMQNLQPYKKTTALTPLTSPTVGDTLPKRQNPFLAAMNTDSDFFKNTYGKNRPLDKPMLLGYRDGEPQYGGSRLFILY